MRCYAYFPAQSWGVEVYQLDMNRDRYYPPSDYDVLG